MISEKRLEILKKNLHTIRALKLKNLTDSYRQEYFYKSKADFECMYTYENNDHCAVGACLTEEEQNLLLNSPANAGTIDEIIKRGINIEKYEMDTLNIFQNIHDSCCRKSASERQFWNFEKALNQLLNCRRLECCESMLNPYATSNFQFKNLNGEWINNNDQN